MQVVYDSASMEFDENGLKDFFWPLTRKEQEVSRDALLSELVSVARSRNDATDAERDLVSAMLQLLAREGLVLLLTYAVGRRTYAEGHEPVWPAGCNHCEHVGKGIAPPVETSALIRVLKKGPVCHPSWRRYPVRLRRDLRCNGFGIGAIRLANPQKDIYSCHTTDVLEEHARSLDETVKYTLMGEWFSAVDEQSEETLKTPALIDGIVDEVIQALSNAFESIGEELPESFEAYFRNVVVRGSRIINVHLNRVLARPHEIPKRLWTGTGGYIWARLLRHVVRRQGGEVTGHEHGTGESIIRYFNTKTFSDLESADSFVTFNSNHRDWLIETVDERFLVPATKPEIRIPEYSKELVRYAGRPLRGDKTQHQADNVKKKLMYVGPIYVGFSPRVSNHNSDILLIDWQSRLFKKLTEWGYEVLFKPHPEGEQRPPAVFNQMPGVTELYEPFEDVWSQADVYLFDWKSTTAYSTAMSTGLPVVMVDFSFEIFVPEMQALVEKNCALVKGWADDKNRLQTDWSQLKAAIDNPPSGNGSELREKVFKFA